MQTVKLILVVMALLGAAWFYDDWNGASEPITTNGQTVIVADGDSFSVGTRMLRLDGIDAPEYRQSCNDERGVAWECGKASRAALESLLRQPGLVCTASATDKYTRAIANCSTTITADVAATQVRNGMAVSDDFYGIQSYGEEEDSARAARQGLWTGEFLRPDEWRAANGR